MRRPNGHGTSRSHRQLLQKTLKKRRRRLGDRARCALAVRFLRCYMARGWPEVLDAASYLEGDKRFTKAQIAEALRRVEPSADSESGCERGGESGGMSGGMSGGESGSESGGESGGEMSESD